MLKNKHLKLFESCLITQGVSRSLIADVQRHTYYLVPNSLVSLFDINHVFKIPKETDKKIISEYVDFLIDNEICFYCDADLIDRFPALDIERWDYPSKITNAIIEVNSLNQLISIKSVLDELTQNLNTLYIEFHIKNSLSLEELQASFQMFDKLDLYNYIVAFPLSEKNDMENVIQLIHHHYKIFRAIIFNAGEDKFIESDKGNWGNIFIMSGSFSHETCGIVGREYFSNNIYHYTESQRHNTCLNRKIAIDTDGNIKNCPSIDKTYGNIKDTTLIDIVNNPEFQKLWYISKVQISVCKDCEFRHICTDCRAYLENPRDIHSKPLKCGYNPYTCEWEEWSTNPLKQNAIDYYGMREMVNQNA